MRCRMTSKVLRAVALLLLHSLWLGTSQAADPDGLKFDLEISKQTTIYYSEGERVPAGYTVDRTLADYAIGLSSGFAYALAGLGPMDRWLDIGAGKGQAILDYYAPAYDPAGADERAKRGGKAQAVALSIEDRTTPQWRETAAKLAPNQLRYLSGKRLREYAQEELGRFQLITDVIGGFSYSTDLGLFVERALSLLELNGSFYTLLQDVRAADGANQPFYKGAPFLIEIMDAKGSEVRVCSWLKSITCVEVTCTFNTGWKPPVEAYGIRKICNEVKVPALVPTQYEAGTPPQRRFQLKN